MKNTGITRRNTDCQNGVSTTRYSLKIPWRVTRSRSKSIIHVSSKYESLDYDVWENELLVKEEQTKGYSHIVQLNIIRWILYVVIGVITGVTAVVVDIAIENLTYYKYKFLKHYLDKCVGKSCSSSSVILWYLAVVIPVILGSVIVIFIEPSAAGSGLPSVISHLNGVRIPRFTNFKVLVIKTASVICSCVAGLACGKEGPFIHIGSMIGGLITNVRTPKFNFIIDKMCYLNTERERRDFMAAGCAAGVSAAFGSPVGATLMSLEEGASFWSVTLMCSIFFCAVVSFFTFNTLLNAVIGNSGQHAYFGLFYFGKFDENIIQYEYFELPIFIGIGVIGGLMGAAFIKASTRLTIFRMKYERHRYLQMIDILVVSMLTASFGIWSMYAVNKCRNSSSNYAKNSVQMFCDGESFNELSIFWLHTQESILRFLFHSEVGMLTTSPNMRSDNEVIWPLQRNFLGMITLVIFCSLYYILVTLTLGINISAGIFIPSLLVGATWGRLIGLVIRSLFPNAKWAVPSKYALLGAAAHLGGVARITISLSVVIIEATGTLSFGLPLMLTLFTTKWVGDFFTESIYETQINLLGIPILRNEPAPLTSDITATDLMQSRVYVFPMMVSVGHLADVLENVAHHGFPVVKHTMHEADGRKKNFGQLRGFILRSQLMALLYSKTFETPVFTEDIDKVLNLFRQGDYSAVSVQEMELSEEERRIILDLKPYMNPSPYTISRKMSFPRIFRLFRSLGLRHVIVINNKNEVIGVITRKDLAKFRLWRHATTMGLKELRIY